MSPADTLERDLARALAAKADQLVVADPPPAFRLDERPDATVIHLTPPPPSRRRVAVAAAAAAVALAVLVTGVTVRGEEPEVAVGPVLVGASGAAGAGPLGYLPAPAPDGWSLATMDVGPGWFEDAPQRWQLFGAPGTVPAAPGVLVGSTPRGARAVDDTNAHVRGVPARVGPSPHPSHPAGTISAQWIEEDVVHDAVAVGMTGDEVVAFLDSLTARPDAAEGFDVPSTASLPEVGAATVTGARGSSVTYRGPGGTAETVSITASSTDHYGGLLQQLAGTAGTDGWSLVRRADPGAGGPAFVSAVSPDGWSVEVTGSDAVDQATVDAFLGSLHQATGDDLVDVARGQPVTARHAVGGWSVELRGTAQEDVGLCLTAPGAPGPVCSTAEAVSRDPRLTAASLHLDGRWIVVTITADVGADVQTAPSDPRRWTDHEPVELSPRAVGRGDGLDVSLYQVPAGTEAVEAVVMTGDSGIGVVYHEPGP